MTEDNKAQEQIAEHRARIDEIDCHLVKLLNERAAESLAIRELKPAVHWGRYDPSAKRRSSRTSPAATTGRCTRRTSARSTKPSFMS